MNNENEASTRVDPLTGCLPESELRPELERNVMKSLLEHSPLALLVLTVNGFSRYQKKWGSAADDILKFVSSTFRLSFENTPCLVFRCQDDGFAVIFPGSESEVAERCTRRVVSTMRQRPFLLRGHLFRIKVSGGIAALPDDAVNVTELMARALEARKVARWGIYGGLMQYRLIVRRLILGGTLLVAIALLISMSVSRFLFAKTTSPASLEIKSPALLLPDPKQPVLLSADWGTTSRVDQVVLKSGGILEGTIIRQSQQETEMRLDMNKGSGIIIIRDADIQSLQRHR